MDSLKLFVQELRAFISTDFDFGIEFDYIDFTVWFSYQMYESSDIPITYTTLENFAYFNNDKYLTRLKDNGTSIENVEFGFDSEEISTMNILCEYLTKNKDIIQEIVEIMDKVM